MALKVILFGLILTVSSIDANPTVSKAVPDPNNVRHYLSFEAVQRLESSFKISTDLALVTFYLWTPENGPDNYFKFTADTNPEELLAHHFNPNRDTKFLSHGWNSDGVGFANKFVKGYFSHPELNYNVIALDWQPLSTWDNYFIAASNAVNIGKHAGEVIGVDLLMKGLGQSPHQIHAIGHSLGGHLVGHFGRSVKEIGQAGMISRVTALDPAKPWFDLTDEANKVSKNDATFVDVVHTNSGFLLDGRLSLTEALGHMDFYPNGGSHQPGCNDMCLIANWCFEFNLWDLFKSSCSHSRSHEYYVESIFTSPFGERFIGTSCDSWNHYEDQDCHDHIDPEQMGEGLKPESVKTEKNGKVSFFLTTNAEPPFSTTSSIE